MANSKAKTKTKHYDAEASRRRILAAAVAEFSCYGFHGARVDRIASKAKANKRLIYLYFGDKKAIYRRVFLDNYKLVLEQERFLALTEADLPNLTSTILGEYYAFHERNPDYWRFLTWENLDPGAGLPPEELSGISSRITGHLEALYHAGQKKGIFRKEVSFSTYIFTLMALSFFYRSNLATMSATLGQSLEDPDCRANLLNELAALVDRGAAGK